MRQCPVDKKIQKCKQKELRHAPLKKVAVNSANKKFHHDAIYFYAQFPLLYIEKVTPTFPTCHAIVYDITTTTKSLLLIKFTIMENNDVDSEYSFIEPIKLSLDLDAEVKSIPHREKKSIFSVATIKAPLHECTSRPPIDLCVVIDRSGSMDGDPLNLCKQTLAFVIEQMQSKDKLAVVIYGSSIKVVFDFIQMDAAGKERALLAVETIQSSGCTNLSGGLFTGMNLLTERSPDQKGEVMSLLLLTDGLANEGLTKAPEIIAAMRDPSLRGGCYSESAEKNAGVADMLTISSNNCMNNIGNVANVMPIVQQQCNDVDDLNELNDEDLGEALGVCIVGDEEMEGAVEEEEEEVAQQQCAQQCFMPPFIGRKIKNDIDLTKGTGIDDANISIYTFGYGTGHDADLMKSISDAGGGVYYFIEDKTSIPSAFANCLGGLVSTVAQKVSVCIESVNGSFISKVHTRYKYETDGNGQKFIISVGDIQSEEERNLVFELNVPELNSPVECMIFATAEVEYFNVVTNNQESVKSVLELFRPTTVNEADTIVPERIDIQKNRIIAAEAMEQANKLNSKGQIEDMKKVLLNAMNSISISSSQKTTLSQGLQKDLKQCLDDADDREKSKYTQTQMVQRHWNERSNDSGAMGMYQTKARGSMVRKSKNAAFSKKC